MVINAISQGAINIFNDTWGHYSPRKNTSYKGKVRFVLTDHSQYGCQPIILEYNFPDLEGPYLHEELFDIVCEWDVSGLRKGVIYERELTFRNYRFYYKKITTVLKEME